MIYTVTFNPSLDYMVSVKDFQLGMTNRTTSENIYPGGKGLNVSIVLKNLREDSVALGFTAGFVGEEIKRRLQNYGLNTDFIEVFDGCSRINIKLENVDGTEINGSGPNISDDKVDELYKKLDDLKSGDVLVLAGSIPSSMSDMTYSVIMDRIKGKKVMTVVDASSSLLINVLKYNPFLVKPNQHELGDIYGVRITSKDEAAIYAKKLQESGARNVLVSMGADGAILLTEDGSIYKATSPKGKLINSVGAGDSMVAGFIKGWLDHNDYEAAFKMALATGSASAFSEGLATKTKVEELLEKIELSCL